MTIYYEAPCDLEFVQGVWCNDDGESVIDSLIERKGDLVIPASSSLVLDMDSYRASMPPPPQSVPPLVSVAGKLTLNGKLRLAFSKGPDTDVSELWALFEAKDGNILGRFTSITANLSDANILEEMCERFDLTVRQDRVLWVSTRKRNICWEAAKSHPGVTAAIVLSVLGVFFTMVVLFVLWRKRRFEKSRAAVLSSPLAEEAEMQEMRLADTKSYSETAKMIESTSGRFEIGEDDIDDSHPEL